MCGRFSLYSDPQKIAKQFSLINFQEPSFIPSYNIAPSQSIYVICNVPSHNNKNEGTIKLMQWGLIPFWTKEEDLAAGIINARLETVDKKPAFRQAIKQHRCLIIADGFYEWKAKIGYKQPYYICTKDNSLFGFAGIWSHWQGTTGTIDSCAILTIPANKTLASIHDRMPAIVKPEHYAKWLDVSYHDMEKLKSLLAPYPEDNLTLYPVSRSVNNFRHNSADCIEPTKE